jgi:poly-gamma-glutamate capsule biosynthesis protein CapA/YwtB (metallophosphatase superfamily)
MARTSLEAPRNVVRLFLCGDVMTGRGVDQVMASPCDPGLYEAYARSALDYVQLAEAANGPIPRCVGPSYVWGDALDAFAGADVRIVNLETSVTRSQDYEPKGINYRMSPENADCLAAAGIDCCVLANNHVLDWGRAGLLDTLAALRRMAIRTCGAGADADEAATPATVDLAGRGRVLVFACAFMTSGTPSHWAATTAVPGVNLLAEPSAESAAHIVERIARTRRRDDVVVVSLHWGPNWGYEIPDEQRRFAHVLIDEADVSIVHGHSSHHAKAIEVYRDRLVLYGCGDFLNDYEGIRGHEAYRGDLAVAYLADIDATARTLVGLELVPFRIRQFRLMQPARQDAGWLAETLDRESQRFGTRVVPAGDRRLRLEWRSTAAG